MKGETTSKILEAIGDSVVEIGDIFLAILSAGYGASHRTIDFERSKLQRGRERLYFRKEQEKILRKRYSSLLFKLKRDHLIQEEEQNGKRFFRSTLTGKNKLRALKNTLPTPHYKEDKGRSNSVTIISFDIPELERRKRFWLRSALKQLGFQLIQKSVWMGKVNIPKEFLDDLRTLKIINYLEIFTINKSGSLREIL
jgi:DNA-binding transcriptional regulator PaaX